MSERTINEKRDHKFEKNREGYMGGFGGRKKKTNMISKIKKKYLYHSNKDVKALRLQFLPQISSDIFLLKKITVLPKIPL